MAPGIQRSFDDMGASLFDVPFCTVDLETTGGSPRDSEITEIGAVLTRGGEEMGRFQSLVDPGAAIPPFITVLTGITHAMVVDAPPIDEALPAFLEFLGEAVIVGHNVRFDLSFLNAAAERLGYGRLPHRSIDTAALARRLIRKEVRSLRLQSLAAHLRSPVAPNHRALDDALATSHVFHALLERAGAIGVTALEDLLLLPTARGAADYRKIGMARDLPRAPGVYLFHDRHDEVIYVGKAKNLRTRVSQYFYGDQRRSNQDLLRQLERVETRVCSTVLEAEITELRLIHQFRPRFNRRSRPPRSTHWVTLTSQRFPRLSVTRTLHTGAPFVLGPFRSKRTADVVVAGIWDAVPIRRCTGPPGSRSGPCAPAQLGVAACPCDGTLTESEYAPIVEQVANADIEPSLLLDPVRERMVSLARMQRFEEAAWVRDRYRALARSLDRRRTWTALQQAGRIDVERIDGERAVIDDGRFVSGWRGDSAVPLIPPYSRLEPTPVPPTIGISEEMSLIWKWLNSDLVRIVDTTGPLALPGRPVPMLDAG